MSKTQEIGIMGDAKNQQPQANNDQANLKQSVSQMQKSNGGTISNNPQSAVKNKKRQLAIQVDAEHDQTKFEFEENDLPNKQGYSTQRPYNVNSKGSHYHQQDQSTIQQTIELKKAFNKASKLPKGSYTSRLNKTHSFNLLQRFQGYQKKRENQIQEKRAIQQQRKYHGVKSKPDIDPHSAKLAKQMSYKPIYQRFEQILESKKRKEQQALENKKAKQQQQYEEFLEEYQKCQKVKPENCRNSEAYFNDMMNWKNKLQKQREQKLKQKQKSQLQGVTFKPHINQKSLRMLKNHKRIPIYERQIANQKPINVSKTLTAKKE